VVEYRHSFLKGGEKNAEDKKAEASEGAFAWQAGSRPKSTRRKT
jgi:hypothetical protein